MAVSAKISLRNIVVVIACLSMAVSYANAKQPKHKKVTRESWPELTLGKKVMIYFYYPWCDYCSEFKPTWKQLKKEYESDEIVFLDANCDDKVTDYLCTDFNVQGTPEVHYGVTTRMIPAKDIDEEDLVEIITKTLKEPICSIEDVDACPEKLRDDMTAIDKMTTEYLEKLAALKIENQFQAARGVVQMNGIRNGFWKDISDIEYIYGTTDNPINPYGEGHDSLTNSAMSIEEQMEAYESGEL
jgi:thiol-disulfide isomerase/thioredoxin